MRAQPSPETDGFPEKAAACPCEPVKRAGVPSPSASQAGALSTLPESAEEFPPVIRMPVSQGRKMRLERLWDLHKVTLVVECMCPFSWAEDDQRIGTILGLSVGLVSGRD